MTGPFIFEEAMDLLCGDKLGEGMFRKVFACRIDPTLVVKIEKDGDAYNPRFANAMEWDIWDCWQFEEDTKKWLAPCEFISPNGKILLQKRVDPIPAHLLPAKIPAFLTDIKTTNFGYYQGRVVCCDYAMLIANPKTGMKKARWNL